MITAFVFLCYGLLLSRKLYHLKQTFGYRDNNDNNDNNENDDIRQKSEYFGRNPSQVDPSTGPTLKELFTCSCWDCSLPNRIQTSGLFIFMFAVAQGIALFGGVKMNYNATLLNFSFGMMDFALFMTFLAMFAQSVRQLQTPNFHNLTVSSQPSEETWNGTAATATNKSDRDRLDSSSLLKSPLLRDDSTLSSEASEYAYESNHNGKPFSPKTLSFYNDKNFEDGLVRSTSELGVLPSKSMYTAN